MDNIPLSKRLKEAKRPSRPELQAAVQAALIAGGAILGANAADAVLHTADAQTKLADTKNPKQAADKAEEQKIMSELQKFQDDPEGFIKRVYEYRGKIPNFPLHQFVERHPVFALEHMGAFKNSLSEKTMLYWALEHMDQYSAMEWAEKNRKVVDRIVQELEAASIDTFPYKTKMLERFSRIPSRDVMGLITSFYLKHQELMIDKDTIAKDIDTFIQADQLIRKYPLVGEYAAKHGFSNEAHGKASADQHALYQLYVSHGGDLEKAKRRHAELAGKVRTMTKEWATRFNAQNPLSLAKTAVLVARDLALRDVQDSPEEVKTSIGRIEAGIKRFQSLKLLENRDLVVLVSGDSDINLVENDSQTANRIHERLDWTSFGKIHEDWQRQNKDGKEAVFNVPFNAKGEVTQEDMLAIKKDFLNHVASAGKPRTTIIATHGLKDSIALYDSSPRLITAEGSISVVEFAVAHIERLQHPDVRAAYAKGERDVYVFTQCQSFDFAYNLFKLLKMQNVPLPIVIASSEKGGANVYNRPSEVRGAHDRFLSTVSTNTQQPLGIIARNALSLGMDGVYGPMIILVPDENEKPVQVTENEGKAVRQG